MYDCISSTPALLDEKMRGNVLEDVESSDSGEEGETVEVGERKNNDDGDDDDDDDDDDDVISGSDGEIGQEEQLKRDGNCPFVPIQCCLLCCCR